MPCVDEDVPSFFAALAPRHGRRRRQLVAGRPSHAAAAKVERVRAVVAVPVVFVAGVVRGACYLLGGRRVVGGGRIRRERE